MKNLLVFLSAFVFFVACTNTAKKEAAYQIKGKIEGAKTEKVTLNIREKGEFVIIDSVQMKEGTFELKGSVESPEMCYLFLEGKKQPLTFFLENSTIEIHSYVDSLAKGKVKGSISNDSLEIFNRGIQAFEQKFSTWYEKYKQAKSEDLEEKVKELEAEYDEINGKQMDYIKTYISENKSNVTTPFIIRRHLMYGMDEKQLDSTLGVLDTKLSVLKDYKIIKERITALEKVAVGKKYTDFTLNTPEGKPFQLSSVVGEKYILIDFWASWCSPCRNENPNVARIYKKYHDKGFDIVGVSLDRTKDRWEQAIKEDGLVWNHCSDLKGWQNGAAKKYAVSGIPHTVLLDKDGIIIAKNLKGEALEEKLAELLQ